MALKFDYFQAQREDESNERFLDLIIHRDYSNEVKPIVRIFKGKQSKPFINYYYSTVEKAEARIQVEKNATERRINEEAAEQAKLKAAKTNFKSSFSEGSILTGSWGYDQTNVEFYEVLSVKGMSVVLQEIGQSIEEDGFCSGRTMPNTNIRKGSPVKKRICISVHGDSTYERVKIGSCIRLSLWGGESRYISWYA